MKKLMMFAACAMLSAVTNAAAVGWSLAGATGYAGDAYQFFVVGQNGVSSVATITALLDAGTSTADYSFGSGTIAANGAANVAYGESGKALDAGKTYTGFYVIFDSATPTSGSTSYAVVSEASGLTVSPSAQAASMTFVAGNQATFLNNTANWKSYGEAVPEPTSGLLMLLGVAGLALRRRRA